MKVGEILLKKGQEVKAVTRDEPLSEIVRKMRRHQVGAMVVRTSGGGVAGVVSESDVVRALADFGTRALAMSAAEIMGPGSTTCAPDESLRAAAKTMTERRARHLPVVWDQRLVGIVSLGDVVKHRLDEMELETSVLRDLARAGPDRDREPMETATALRG